jgi:hypothetical protein
MNETATMLFDIRVVTEIQQTSDSTQFAFQGGLTATLTKDHPDYSLFLDAAKRSMEWQEPVGLILSADRQLLDLVHSHQSNIHILQEDEDGKGLAIGFWSVSPICYLAWDHPEFDRIRNTLEEALTANSHVLIAYETWPVVGETEIWTKILDVRPVPVPEPAGQANGTAATASPAAPQAAVNVKP